MPVRSLSSPVLKWPDAKTVIKAVRQWAKLVSRQRPDVSRIGYFGSYARGNWGVGSDLDVVIVLDHDSFERRAARWDLSKLPVPVDLLVYTEAEWQAMSRFARFGETLARDGVWVFSK